MNKKKEVQEQILKTVKPFGDNGAHIVVPKKLLGKVVIVSEASPESG